MKFPQNPHKIAGLLSLLAAILILPFWYILLFVAQPSNIPVLDSATTTLNYMFFTANPARSYVIWHAVAPLASLILGGFYLLGFSRSRLIAKILFALSLALGISAIFFSNLAIAFWVALPCYWGYLSLTHHSSGTPNGAP